MNKCNNCLNYTEAENARGYCYECIDAYEEGYKQAKLENEEASK